MSNMSAVYTAICQEINYKLSNLVWHKCQLPVLLLVNARVADAGSYLPTINMVTLRCKTETQARNSP